MRYDYDFDNKKDKRIKKIIFIIATVIVIVVSFGFVLKGNSNKTLGGISDFVLFPINKTYEIFANIASNSKNHFSKVEEVNIENEKLKQENLELKLQILETQKISDENKNMKEMLSIKNSFQHFNMKFGKVMYREHDNWSRTFKINIGVEEGIKVNQAVVHANGLVGFISDVERESSTVTTILDPATSVSVNISSINEPAILQGDLTLNSKNRVKLVFIPLDSEISISDTLYTSGLGSIYPSAIPVGKIVEVFKNKNDINRYAIVEPNVNISSLKEVAVVLN